MSPCGQVSSIHFKGASSRILKRVLVSLVCRKDVVPNKKSVCTLNAGVFLHCEPRFTNKLVTMALITLLWSPHLLSAEREFF